MAPPEFPNGMTLHSIGYAALKYPKLADECPVPLGNQLGVLQQFLSPTDRSHAIDQISSQYLDAFLEYQTSDDPLLNDKNSSQYYFSAVSALLSFLCTSPDVSLRVARYKEGAIAHDIVEKMLDPDFEKNMKKCDRKCPPPFQPATFDSDFGTMLQLLSTIMLWSEGRTVHPRVQELIPKLRQWKKTYKSSSVRTISNASERLVGQIEGTDPEMAEFVREQQQNHLICGVKSCRKQTGLTACAACKIQRYCGKDHQKADWKYHKHICKKGLAEDPEELPAMTSENLLAQTRP
ncbi:hypothetical protein HYFRA_00007185 [Hymenoscyphus fraxineus]|uniref:MYND-type domain-containing protein n=1 Tax=Hymenoscyphus fraxineus TaxID=746836 RepID=A0A9N9KWI4_9HELO|nr:hypothetical protein HYFRA_00007185 [Hymenoscyphus fraxineus]